MKLKPGDDAPPFEVTSSDGRLLALADFRGKQAIVLYFYPKDRTPGCTAEACGFRDMYADLVRLDAQVIGVSMDSDASHQDARERYRIPFPLVSDPQGKLAELYGAVGPLTRLIRMTRRVTYVIDKQGKIRGIYSGMLDIGRHLATVRETLAELR